MISWIKSLFTRKKALALAPIEAPAPEMRATKASSFADPQDLRDYAKSGSFAKGDNGIGCWGTKTATDKIAMCALPPPDMIAKWGSIRAAKHAKVLVRANGQECVCILADRMPWSPKNGAGIDLNPGAAKALKLRPPFMVAAEWGWI